MLLPYCRRKSHRCLGIGGGAGRKQSTQATLGQASSLVVLAVLVKFGCITLHPRLEGGILVPIRFSDFTKPNGKYSMNHVRRLPASTTANGCFKKIFETGTPPVDTTGWSNEVAIDTQWAH